MLFVKLYYQLKPTIPGWLRLRLRRLVARRQRRKYREVWPINPGAAGKPAAESCWPAGKKFAVTLTHDVETKTGLRQVPQLAALEMELGFRSAFYFIPEGPYRVPAELRSWLVENGFEIGVHGIKHDGKLYASRKTFLQRGGRINRYLREWGAVGFRSPFMQSNLDWIHDLEIEYDASTFDTDPFEPQPEGINTIFPRWIMRDEGRESAWPGKHGATSQGYVELPYTLPQDSTLFLVLQERTIDVWKRKLDWIAEHGGMAHVIVHPDYVRFAGGEGAGSHGYPVGLYRDFLLHLRQKFEGEYWAALPKEIARLARGSETVERQYSPPASCVDRKRIWVDLDNTPHVPFFTPIIKAFEEKGYGLLVTARDAYQVCEMAAARGLEARKIGRHFGRNKVLKVLGTLYRAGQLLPVAARQRPALGISHGSRSQLLACRLLGIPTIRFGDYEFSRAFGIFRSNWEVVPEVIPDDALSSPLEKVRRYPGIKEDVYVRGFVADEWLPTALGIDREKVIATVRPPATEAHYHNPESERLFEEFMHRAWREPGVVVVLLPRNSRQGAAMSQRYEKALAAGKVIIPEGPVDGLSLLWQSDLVVSGGGTMNREAAALGVPVFSIFRGRIGAVDRQLAREGRLALLTNTREIYEKVVLRKRKKKRVGELSNSETLTTILDCIEEIVEIENQAGILKGAGIKGSGVWR